MTEIEEKIQDAEIEISLAVGCLEWARTKVTNPVRKHIYDHICGRILGLDAALNTLKELEKIALKGKADVHGFDKD